MQQPSRVWKNLADQRKISSNGRTIPFETAVPDGFIQLCFCQDTTCISIVSAQNLHRKDQTEINHGKSCDKMEYIAFFFI